MICMASFAWLVTDGYKLSVYFPGLQMCPMPARVALQSRDGFQKSERQRRGRRIPRVVTAIGRLAGHAA